MDVYIATVWNEDEGGNEVVGVFSTSDAANTRVMEYLEGCPEFDPDVDWITNGPSMSIVIGGVNATITRITLDA